MVPYLARVYDKRDPRLEKVAIQIPEIVTLENRGGVKLYGVIYRPP